MTRATRHTLCGLLAATLTVSGAAFAQSSSSGSSFDQPNGLFDRTSHDRKPEIAVFVSMPYFYGFGVGVGARYSMPLLKDGFIDSLNDSVELELGADYAFTWSGLFGSFNEHQFDLAAEGRWTFHMTPQFDLYGKLGIGPGFWVASASVAGLNASSAGFLFYFDVAAGARYRLSDTFLLRAELGSYGLRLGLAWEF